MLENLNIKHFRRKLKSSKFIYFIYQPKENENGFGKTGNKSQKKDHVNNEP